MAGYSSAEIEASVSKFVQSTLKIDRSPLGPVDADSKFNEVITLISSTMIYDPNAVFYLLFLATNRLNVDVLAAISYLDDLLNAIDEMSKRTKDVTRTSLLGDAAASLLTVDQALTSKDALSNQAYGRYQAAVDRFIDVSLKGNIKTGSAVVRPPQLARVAAKADLESLAVVYASLLGNTTQLQGALDEFNALNLPLLTVRDSVRKVRSDLQSLQVYFESSSYTKDERIAACRGAYLRMVSGRAVLDNYTTVEDPVEPRIISSASIVGSIAPSISTGQVDPATVVGTTSGPWVISGSKTLNIAADGDPASLYTLTEPPLASVRCYAAEPYDIVFGASDRLEIDGLPFTVALTAGVGRTAAQIAANITTWMLAHYPGQYSAAVLVEGGKNYVKVTKTTVGINSITMTAESVVDHDAILSAYGLLGFYEGQRDDSTGISADEVVALINAVGEVTASVDRTLFEEGTSGEVIDAVTLDVPRGTFASLSHGDDQLLIRLGPNAGYHRIVSVTQPGSPAVDRITIDASMPFVDISPDQDWLVLREYLRLTSKSTGLETDVSVEAGSANVILGLTSGHNYGLTTGFRATESGLDVDFSQYDVVVGDVLYLTDTTPVQTQHLVTSLSSDSKQLEFDPPVSTAYALAAFQVLSTAAEAYELFSVALAGWVNRKDASNYSEDTLELDRAMNPLLVNKQPSLAQLADARTAANELRDLLTKISPAGLSDVLVSFVVSPVSRIDAALKMLRERGLDRAFDLLMRAQLANFFNMDKDDAGSSAFMLKSMRSVVQSDLQVSKLDDDVGDTVTTDTIIGTDADFDFSDQDPDENIRILGEVPDFDNPADEKSTEHWRY